MSDHGGHQAASCELKPAEDETRWQGEYRPGPAVGPPGGEVAAREEYAGQGQAQERLESTAEEELLADGTHRGQKGGRSQKAAQLLSEAGFSNLHDMRGGYHGETDVLGNITFPGWASRNLPTTAT